MAGQEHKREYLPNVINSTRLARIEAERRLLYYDRLAKTANLSFACWTASLSLLSLIKPSAAWLTFSVVGTSVTLAIISAYTSSQNYGSRAAQMHANYIELHSLWLEFDSVAVDMDPDERADQIGDRYLQLLACSENHTTADCRRSREPSLESDTMEGTGARRSGDDLESGRITRVLRWIKRRPIKFCSKHKASCMRAGLMVLVAISPAIVVAATTGLYVWVEHACI